MPGHGCPERGPGPGVPGAGAPRGAAEPLGGCADVLVVVCVVVVPLEDAGAAADTAMPPTAPAEASAPVITATLTAFEDIISEWTSWVGWGSTPTMLRRVPKELARSV